MGAGVTAEVDKAGRNAAYARVAPALSYPFCLNGYITGLPFGRGRDRIALDQLMCDDVIDHHLGFALLAPNAS